MTSLHRELQPPTTAHVRAGDQLLRPIARNVKDYNVLREALRGRNRLVPTDQDRPFLRLLLHVSIRILALALKPR